MVNYYTFLVSKKVDGFRHWQKFCSWLLVVRLLVNGCASYRSPIPSLSPPSEDEETKIAREFRREAKKHLKWSATGKPVASFHTAEGSTDPATLGPIDDLESLCAAHQASACVVMRERAMADIELYLAEPLGPDQDFVTRVMRFVRVVRQLGNGNWLRVWPNPLPDLLLSAAPVAKPASDLLLPHGHSVILGVFEENGDLWTSAVLRRDVAELDVLAGPRALSDWAGPLGGEWRRDHRVLVRAVERELGPVHLGLFMEAPTARRLVRGRGAGDWAMAFVTRDLLIHPLPAFAAAGLGLDVLAGAAQQIAQTLEQMESEELVSIAQGMANLA